MVTFWLSFKFVSVFFADNLLNQIFKQNIDRQTGGHRQSIDRNCMSNPANDKSRNSVNIIFGLIIMISNVNGVDQNALCLHTDNVVPQEDEISRSTKGGFFPPRK